MTCIMVHNVRLGRVGFSFRMAARCGVGLLASLLVAVLTFGRVTPAYAGGRLELRAEGEQRSVDCGGRDVIIDGNLNTDVLRGGCGPILLRGEGAVVRADMAPGSLISIEGNDVRLSWRLVGGGLDPVVSVKGRDSMATRDGDAVASPLAPPAVPAAAPVAISAADKAPIDITISGETRDLDCAGREVHITADRGLYALRGGCRAVIVHGDNDFIQAEVVPGARIELLGKNVKLAFVMVGAGAPSVHAEGEASKAWAIDRWGGLTGPVP